MTVLPAGGITTFPPIPSLAEMPYAAYLPRSNLTKRSIVRFE